MIAPRTIAQRLAETRLVGLTKAVAATLRPLFPGVDVRTLPGKLDLSDVLENETFVAPMIAITTTSWIVQRQVSGSYALLVELAAYVITADTVLGASVVSRDAVAYALTGGLLDILEDYDTARWGLPKITSPEAAAARPMFTALTYDKGTAYYAVTWRQQLIALGSPVLEPVAVEEVQSVEDGVTVTWPPDLSEAPA